MRSHRLFVLLFFLPVFSPCGAAGEHPLDSLQPGEWYEVPDSHLEKAKFTAWPKGALWTKNGMGFKAIMSNWSGGAYDTKRERLLIWGGGHFAYAGNELYGFDINALAWERLCDPSLALDNVNEKGETYADGTPRACHTYGYIQYVPTLDRFCSFGTCANFYQSSGGKTCWAFDFEKKKWEAKGQVPSIGFGSASDWDPVRRRIWVRYAGSGACLAEWIPEEDRWSVHAKPDDKYTGHVTAALDPLRRYLYIAGGKRAYRYKLEGDGAFKQEKLATTGPQDIVNAGNPGLQYDPVLDRIVGWNGGADVFLLDPETLAWEKVPPAPTNSVTPTAACKTGTYGRFRYIPSRNAYVVVNAVDENVFLLRLSDTGKRKPSAALMAAADGADAELKAYVEVQLKRFAAP